MITTLLAVICAALAGGLIGHRLGVGSAAISLLVAVGRRFGRDAMRKIGADIGLAPSVIEEIESGDR
jgi:hypothetical protein